MPDDSNSGGTASPDPNASSASTTAGTAQAGASNDPNAANGGAASSSAQTTSWAREWLKEDGSLDHKAFEKAPEDFKLMSKDVERYKTFEEFMKGHRELAGLAGKKGIIDPLPANATPQQVAERQGLLRKVNGVPEKPEGYGLQRPDGVPENMWDQTYADSMAKIAHEEAISPNALKKLAAAELKYTQAQTESNKKAEAAWYEGQDKLIRETAAKEGLDYGKAADLAQRAGRFWGVDPANPLMKNASVFIMLTRIGRAMGEDKLVMGDTGGIGLMSKITPEQAIATANDMLHNKNNPDYEALHNRDNPRYASVREKWENFHVIAAKNRPARGVR